MLSHKNSCGQLAAFIIPFLLVLGASAQQVEVKASARCLSLTADSDIATGLHTIADGVVKLFIADADTVGKEVLSTETIRNNANPVWKKAGTFTYVKGGNQILRAYVYDADPKGMQTLGGPLDFKADELVASKTLSVDFGSNCDQKGCEAVKCKGLKSQLRLEVNIKEDVKPVAPRVVVSGSYFIRAYAKCLDTTSDEELGSLPDDELTLDVEMENGVPVKNRIMITEEVTENDNPYWKKVGTFMYKAKQQQIITARVYDLDYSGYDTLTPSEGLQIPADELMEKGILTRSFGKPCAKRCTAACLGKNSSLTVVVVPNEDTKLDGETENDIKYYEISGSATCLYKPSELTDAVDGELTIYTKMIDGREYEGPKVLGTEEVSNTVNPTWTTTGTLDYRKGRQQKLLVRVYDLEYAGSVELTDDNNPILIDAEEFVTKGTIKRSFGPPCEAEICSADCKGKQAEFVINAVAK